MFTQGQLYFAIFFVIVFTIATFLVYKKDAGLHKLFYKGSWKVLLGFLLFIVFLFYVKTVLKP